MKKNNNYYYFNHTKTYLKNNENKMNLLHQYTKKTPCSILKLILVS